MNRQPSTRIAPILAVLVLVAACGTAPAATITAPAPTAAPQTSAVPAPPDATPPATPLAVATGTPGAGTATTAPWSWVRPKPDARLTSYVTVLAARPPASGSGDDGIDRVRFWVKGADAKRVAACTATTANANGAWTCKADLLGLGVAPGPVRFTFKAEGGEQAAEPASPGALAATYAVPPPKPTKADIEYLRSRQVGRWEREAIFRVSWSAPDGYADEFLLYDTGECPRASSAGNIGKPCFAAGTPVDRSLLELLAEVPGDARTVKLRLPESDCGPAYMTILLRARNAYGVSAFAIVDAWHVPDPNDIIC